jgi:glutamate N-acetyltransferase/amino-acid N-acetyltransferase
VCRRLDQARRHDRAGHGPGVDIVARAAMDAPELVIELDLGLADGHGEAFGCDLTEAYVVENSEYTT